MPAILSQPKHDYQGIIEPDSTLDDAPEWESFPEESGSLGIPRSSMPQIASAHRGAMVQFLKGRGISHTQEMVAPETLKPSQAEYSPQKVEKARSFDGAPRSILISSDDHVLDGHHQWLSALDNPDEPYPAIRFNAPIHQLLIEAARFPSSGVDEAGQQVKPDSTTEKHNYDGIIEQDSPASRRNYDGIVEPAPAQKGPRFNYDGIVEPLRESVTSSVNEDTDFSDETGPIKDYKPLGFTPSDTISELSTLQRVAEGFRQLGSNDPKVRQTSPDLLAKSITLTLPDKGRKPTQQELTDAYFNALGGEAAEVNRRYRNETGRNLETTDLTDEDLEMGYDPQAKTYTVRVAPTQAAFRVIDAYGSGGMKAVHDALVEMQRADDEAAAQQARERDAARNIVRRLGYDPDELESVNPLAKGLARAGLGATRLANNLWATVRNPSDAANDAQFINEAAASIPKSKSAGGRVVESIAEAAGSLPVYAAAGPYGAGLVAYTQNLDRGQEGAIKEGLKMSVAGGVAHGTGIATENLSPAARQFVARHMAGMSNVAIDKLSGSDRNAVESYLAGAVLPVGAKGKEETGLTYDYTHDVLGNLKRVPDQSGVGRGWVRVMTDDGEMGVVRAPNSTGEGGVRLKDGSLPAPTRRTGEKILDAVNILRAVQTSYDLSAIGRQGLMLSVLHPAKAAKNFSQSVGALFSEDAANKVLNDIHSSPYAPLRRESGLYLSDYRHEGSSLTKGEEGFQSSIAQSIPGVRASERAYVTFLDKMRADVFDGYARSHPDATPETLQGIASFINKATGRADLGAWGEKHAQALSQVLYSPRYTLSKIQLPLEMFKGTLESRAYAARNLVQYVGSGIAMMGLAKAAGLQIGADPLRSDFGKIKIGNTYIDLWGGSSTLARYTAQMMTGKATELESGETVSRSRLKTALNFLRTKAAPQISIPLDTALGSDVKG